MKYFTKHYESCLSLIFYCIPYVFSQRKLCFFTWSCPLLEFVETDAALSSVKHHEWYLRQLLGRSAKMTHSLNSLSLCLLLRVTLLDNFTTVTLRIQYTLHQSLEHTQPCTITVSADGIGQTDDGWWMNPLLC